MNTFKKLFTLYFVSFIITSALLGAVIPIPFIRDKFKLNAREMHKKDLEWVVQDWINRQQIIKYLNDGKEFIDQSGAGSVGRKRSVMIREKSKIYKRNVHNWIAPYFWMFQSQEMFLHAFFTGKNAGKRQAKIIIVTILILAILIHPVFGIGVAGLIRYADDNIGDDAYNGESQTDDGGGVGPYKTLKPFESLAGSLNPDDQCLVKRGQTFVSAEYWTFNTGGTDGNEVIFGAYGNPLDARPIIVNGASWYISCRANYVKFESWNVTSTGQTCMTFDLDDQQGIYIDDCVYDGGATSIGNSLGGDTFEITNCDLSNTTGVGINIIGSPSNPLNGIKIQNCVLHETGNDSISIHRDGSNNDVGAGHEISNCEIYSPVAENCLDATSGDNIKIFDNTLYDCPSNIITIAHGAYDVEVYRCKIYDCKSAGGGGIHITVPDVTVWGCEITGYLNANDLISLRNDGGHHMSNINIIKNTFISNDGDYMIWISDGDGDLGNVNISNNIFSTKVGNYPVHIIHFQDASFKANDPSFTCDKNVFDSIAPFVCGDTDDNSISWADWQTAGHDTNGLNTDPLFTDRTGGDYTILVGSPARELGPGGSAFWPDIAGVSKDGTRGCAGAYEYDSGEVPIPAPGGSTVAGTLTMATGEKAVLISDEKREHDIAVESGATLDVDGDSDDVAIIGDVGLATGSTLGHAGYAGTLEIEGEVTIEGAILGDPDIKISGASTLLLSQSSGDVHDITVNADTTIGGSASKSNDVAVD